jgi:hypothetical protein
VLQIVQIPDSVESRHTQDDNFIDLNII